MIGVMSKRGQNTTSNDGSPTAKARPVNLVMHSPCNEDSSTRFGISGQSVDDCRNDLMVHVSFLEPTNEKVHQQCSRRVCAKTRSGLSDRITNKKSTDAELRTCRQPRLSHALQSFTRDISFC